MANFNVPENPKFTDSLQQLSTSDRCHAGVFNAIYEKLFHNDLFLKAKAAVMETEIAQAIAIALGRNQALVFETYDAMAAWFADKKNTAEIAALANGTNLYIVDTDVPDYWWSSDAQQYYQLETQKADLTKYDNIIGKKDIAALSDDGTITGALVAQKNNFASLEQNVGGNLLIAEGSGANTKYYIQQGADSASKKLLGKVSPNMYVWTTSPVDIKALMPDIYSQLTNADFWAGNNAAWGHESYSNDHPSPGQPYVTISWSYNSTQGLLTFSTNNYSASGYKASSIGEWRGTTKAVYLGTIAGAVQ